MTENDPILDVYERFKHLDRTISEAGQDEDSFHKTCAALWVAVKKHRAQVKKEKTCKTCGWSRRNVHDRTGEYRVCVNRDNCRRDGMDGPKERVTKRAQNIRSTNPNISVRVLKVSPGRYQVFVKP